jgi:hypothetical protein
MDAGVTGLAFLSDFAQQEFAVVKVLRTHHGLVFFVEGNVQVKMLLVLDMPGYGCDFIGRTPESSVAFLPPEGLGTTEVALDELDGEFFQVSYQAIQHTFGMPA